MRLKPARSSAGFSLVELMIGIAVGLVLLVGLTSVYVSSVRGGRTTTTANQLNQEMRALMDIMVNDIRRAGYWEAATLAAPNPWSEATTLPTTVPVISAGGSCILYSYDAPAAIGSKFFGFQLAAGGVVQALNPAGVADTSTPCANAAWGNLTDEVSTEVTQLSFNTIGSKCIAIEIDNPATVQQWTTAAGTGLACDPAASNAPSPYPNAATHYFVETRQVNIVLAARSRNDTALPTQTLTETVLVRTNRVVAP